MHPVISPTTTPGIGRHSWPAAWRDLTAALEGDVVLPGSPRYDEVRRPQIPRFHDVRPQAVVLCRTPGDVVKAIAFARRSGTAVAVRSGGHDFARRSSGPGMVLDLTPMRFLEVADGLATMGRGLRLGDLYPALAPTSHDPGRLRRHGRYRWPGAAAGWPAPGGRAGGRAQRTAPPVARLGISRPSPAPPRRQDSRSISPSTPSSASPMLNLKSVSRLWSSKIPVVTARLRAGKRSSPTSVLATSA